jgi:hypothetical protein
MRPKNRIRPALEALSERLAPATFTSSGSGGTLVINQVDPAVGAIVITDNPGAGTVTIDDIADANPPTVISTAGFGSLRVNLKPTDATPVVYDIVSARSGNVTLNIKNTAARALLLDGGFAIGGNLRVVGGNGGLTVSEFVNPLLVGGNATFTGGSGLDMLNLTTIGGSTIGGNLFVKNFNGVGTNLGDAIGGNVSFNSAGESNPNILILNDTTIGGNLKYIGGSGADGIMLGGTTTNVGGNVFVNFGTQGAADLSMFMQAVGPTSVIGGNVRVIGGNLGTENVGLMGVVGGNVRLNMGNGTNAFAVTGMFEGSSINYTGGAGTDMLMYNPLAGSSSAKLKAKLGAGADTVFFGPAAEDPSYAYIDFGSGVDTVLGVVDFAVTFVNLP